MQRTGQSPDGSSIYERRERFLGFYWFGLCGVRGAWPLLPPKAPPAASPPAVAPPSTIAPPRNSPVELPPAAAAAAPTAPAAAISLGGKGARPHTTIVLWPAGTCTDPPAGLVVL